MGRGGGWREWKGNFRCPFDTFECHLFTKLGERAMQRNIQRALLNWKKRLLQWPLDSWSDRLGKPSVRPSLKINLWKNVNMRKEAFQIYLEEKVVQESLHFCRNNTFLLSLILNIFKQRNGEKSIMNTHLLVAFI